MQMKPLQCMRFLHSFTIYESSIVQNLYLIHFTLISLTIPLEFVTFYVFFYLNQQVELQTSSKTLIQWIN